MRKDPPEVIRISEKDYRLCVRKAKAIKKQEDDRIILRTAVKFTGRNRYPSVEQLKRHDAARNMRKLLPFLIYFREPETYQNDEPEFENTRDYINYLFNNYVDIVDDADMEPIDKVFPNVWTNSDEEARKDLLRPLIIYYGREEFETFLKDLGYKKFMSSYGLKKKDCKDGVKDKTLRNHLYKVWEAVQSEPIN